MPVTRLLRSNLPHLVGVGIVRVGPSRRFQQWRHRLPLLVGHPDRQGGYWRECSMAQFEVPRTLTFT